MIFILLRSLFSLSCIIIIRRRGFPFQKQKIHQKKKEERHPHVARQQGGEPDERDDQDLKKKKKERRIRGRDVGAKGITRSGRRKSLDPNFPDS
jgi:hypothetical protein